MARRIIAKTTPHDSVGIYFSVAKDLNDIPLGVPKDGTNTLVGRKNCDFQQINRYISETVQDRGMRSIER